MCVWHLRETRTTHALRERGVAGKSGSHPLVMFCLEIVRASFLNGSRRPAGSLVLASPSKPFPALGPLSHLLLSARCSNWSPLLAGIH